MSLGALGLLAVSTDCRIPPGGPTTAATRQDRVDPAPIEYDPTKAWLTLDQIGPEPAVPEGPREHAAVSPVIQERLDRARGLEAEARYAEAISELEEALREEPSATVHRALAAVFLASGAAEPARSHADRALALRPNDGLGHYLRGVLAAGGTDAAEAITQFRIALRCPDVAGDRSLEALTRYRLAQSLEREGYLSAALEQYRQYESLVADLDDASSSNPELARLLQVNGPTAAVPLAAIHERLGQYAQAADTLRRVLPADGRADADMYARYVRLLARSGRTAEALAVVRNWDGPTPLLVELLKDVHGSGKTDDALIDDLRALADRRPNDLSAAMALSETLAARDRTDEAEHVLREYAAGHPDDADATWLPFDFLTRRQRWVAALDCLVGALERQPERYPAARARMASLAEGLEAIRPALAAPITADVSAARAYVLGCLALDAGDAAGAEPWLRASLERAGDFAGPRVELANLFVRQYRWQDAIDMAQPASASDPQLERVLGHAYAGLDDVDGAVAHFNEAIRLNRADTESMRALAEFFERTEQPLRARRQYELILEENALDHQAREALAMLYLQSGDREAAQAQVARLERLAASPQAVARCRARLAYRPDVADYEGFRRGLLEATGSAPMEAQTAFLVALSLTAERKYDAALPYVLRGLTVDADNVALLDLQVATLRQKLQFAEAEAVLRELVRRYPNREAMLAGLLDLALIQQKHADVVELTQRMLEHETFSAELLEQCRREMPAALRALGRSEEAVVIARQWVEQEPDNPLRRELLLETLMAEKRFDEALERIDAWEQASAGYAGREELVDILTRSGRFDRACQRLLDWLEEDAGDQGLHFDLIAVLIEAGRYDDALELAVANYAAPGSRIGYERIALEAYDAAGRHEEAIRLIQQWIQRTDRGLADDFPFGVEQARAMLVDQMFAAGRLNDARKQLNVWIDGEPNPLVRVLYLNLLGECDRRSGRIAQALESLELAYRMNPLDVNACNSLGYSWSDAGVRLDEAEDLIRYAVAQNPRSYAYLDSMGWVLYKKGDFAGARYWLELARGADEEDDPVILDHLGDTYWRLGDTERAVADWQAAVDAARTGMQRDRRRRDDVDWQRIAQATPAKIEAAAAGQTPDVAPLGGETEPVDSVARRELSDRLLLVGPAFQPVSGSLKGLALARHEKRGVVCLMI
ncbi:MAG: tetratricopeptide repeat protein [Phycisphaerae bacterium]|nr:tetratricopeptide repeat protein [Phycisphaerae bacterium]